MSGQETAIFGSGCFWCSEAVFSELEGVERVEPGYSGGALPNPRYEDVCTDQTGHAEVVQVSYDPSRISYKELLEVFFSTHDPTTLNRQGGDVGRQYRSVVFFHNEAQREAAVAMIKELTEDHVFVNPIVTKVLPLEEFYPAENYHREYYKQNPSQAYCQTVISPKLAKFREHYKSKLKRPTAAAKYG